MSTTTITLDKTAISRAVTNLKAAQDAYAGASQMIARTRVVRALQWHRVGEAMGGWDTRGVPTKMVAETGFKRGLLYVMRDDFNALGKGAADIDLPVIAGEDGQTIGVDYGSDQWDKTPALVKAVAIMVKVYGGRADAKKEERASKPKGGEASKGKGSEGSEETTTDESVRVPTVEDVTKGFAEARNILGMFTSGAGLTKSQAVALRKILADADKMIEAATV